MNNTHASIFTRVPDGVTRTWGQTAITVDGKDIERRSHAHHMYSGLARVELRIMYTPEVASSSESFLSHDDDSANDQIESWQIMRQVYGKLEKSVDAVLQEYNKTQLDLAIDRRCRSLSVLRPEATIDTSNQPDDSSTTVVHSNRRVETLLSTIAPHDSVSHADAAPNVRGDYMSREALNDVVTRLLAAQRGSMKPDKATRRKASKAASTVRFFTT